MRSADSLVKVQNRRQRVNYDEYDALERRSCVNLRESPSKPEFSASRTVANDGTYPYGDRALSCSCVNPEDILREIAGIRRDLATWVQVFDRFETRRLGVCELRDTLVFLTFVYRVIRRSSAP